MLSRLARYASSMMTRASKKLGIAKAVLCLGVFAGVASTVAVPARAWFDQKVYHLKGLVDLRGKEIVPCRYSKIAYLGGGLFEATEAGNGSATESGAAHIFNKNGKELILKLPDKTELHKVYFIKAPKETDDFSLALPADALIEVRSGTKYSIVTSDGNVVMANYDTPVEPYVSHRYLVFRPAGTLFTVLSSDSNKKVFVADRDTGKLILNAQQLANLSLRGGLKQEPPSINSIKWMTSIKSGEEVENTIASNLWIEGLAVASAKVKDGPAKFGLVDCAHKYVLTPQFLTLKHLCDGKYVAQNSPGGPLVLIDASGRLLNGLPPRTYEAKYSQGLIICRQNKSAPLKGRKVSVLNSRFKTLFAALNSDEYAFGYGIAVIRSDLDRDQFAQRQLTVVTRNGVVHTDKELTGFEPVTADHLVAIKTMVALTHHSDRRPE